MKQEIKGGPLTRLIMNDVAGRRMMMIILAIAIIVPFCNLFFPEG